ncbi:hypothetical protein BO71DRAFT_453743 [Aspergillus ellipticus CBS 707.79]|uniref:Uncharacterized protein n=1 Tax=Aspergillus ellipticus CBS 707.79 TaxID=1448320 RepID=A0A319CUQ7_9EURO|nr:hypothetical protein BO71DRAFT_453743 [Aspergillus ellipticus CBS 707.79]
MARTKQTARKSSSRAPRRAAQTSHHFHDHTSTTYTVVEGTPTGCDSDTVIRKLGIQLYILSPLTVSPETIGRDLLRSHAIWRWGNARNYWPRVDVFPTPMGSLEECMAHHRREKRFRGDIKREMVNSVGDEAVREVERVAGEERRDLEEGEVEEVRAEAIAKLRGKEPLPHIVPSWCKAARYWTEQDVCGSRYRSWVLVVPEGCGCWEDVMEKGLWVVKFDLDVSPAMETYMWDDDAEEDVLEGKGWGWVDHNGVDPEVSVLKVSVRDDYDVLGRNVERDEEGKAVFQTSLFHEWVQFTGALWDCTYRSPCCDGCDEGGPHDCEAEMDEHYFDEEGRCVECRRAMEYRRRSKRVAAKKRKAESSV